LGIRVQNTANLGYWQKKGINQGKISSKTRATFSKNGG
jgi:hypothetical protein